MSLRLCPASVLSPQPSGMVSPCSLQMTDPNRGTRSGQHWSWTSQLGSNCNQVSPEAKRQEQEAQPRGRPSFAGQHFRLWGIADRRMGVQAEPPGKKGGRSPLAEGWCPSSAALGARLLC